MRILLVCRASRLVFGSLAAQPAAIDEQPASERAAQQQRAAQQSRAEPPKRSAASGPGWSEVFISPQLASSTQSAADAVASGFSLLLLHELAERSECEELRGEASAVAHASRRRSTLLRGALLEDAPEEAVTPGQVRMPIVEMLCESSQALCDRLLLRGVGRVHGAFPSLLPMLFGDKGIGSIPWSSVPSGPLLSAPSLGPSITRDPGLVFTPGEPACNVYTTGGQFTPHEDGQALTVIVVLSGGEAFSGGGTSFWSATEGAASGRASGARALHVNPQSEPSFVLTPPAGSALVFGGNVTHAGESVVAGERTVFVASFSTRGAR
jgi:hypothetical protein